MGLKDWRLAEPGPEQGERRCGYCRSSQDGDQPHKRPTTTEPFTQQTSVKGWGCDFYGHVKELPRYITS